jgi:hypothetical protein
MDRHNGGPVSIGRCNMMTESESDSDSSSNTCSSDASETIYTESRSSETSTAHSSDEEFIDDSLAKRLQKLKNVPIVDDFADTRITELSPPSYAFPRPEWLSRPARGGRGSRRRTK